MGIRLSNRRKSHFSSLPEGKAPLPKGIGFARILYYAFLAAIIAYVLYYAATRLYFIRASALIAPEQIVVKAPRRSQLTRIEVERGQMVRPGQPLFAARHIADGVEDALAVERLRASRDREQKQATLAALLAELKQQQAIQAQLKADRMLELNRERIGEAVRIDLGVAELKGRIAGLNAEIAAYERFHASLATTSARHEATLDYTVTSPVSGPVISVARNASEYVREGDTVVIIEDPQRSRIQAYFDQSAVHHIAPGRLATLHFADGGEASGRVLRIYSAADDESQPLRHDYQPIKAHAVVEIEPLEVDSTRLRQYRNMEVEVRMRRWP